MVNLYFCSFVGLLLTLHFATATHWREFGQDNSRYTQMLVPGLTQRGYSCTHLQNPRLGTIEPELSRSRRAAKFDPEISDGCRKLGYCIKIPKYPKDEIKQMVDKLGDDVRQKFQMDELDTDNNKIAKRIGADISKKSLCDSNKSLIEPDSLPDVNDVWWTVLQDRDNKKTQRFRAEVCNNRGSTCDPLVSLPPGFSTKCEQKFVLRSVFVVDKMNNNSVAQKSLRIPSCCTCIATQSK